MNEQLARLAGLTARTQAAEQRIHDRAVARDAEVSGRLDQLRPGAMADDDTAREYQTLILERAKLAQVIGVARAHLSA